MKLFSALVKLVYRARKAPNRRFEDRLPWFGEPPFVPAPKGRVPARAVTSVAFVRRVLLAWLGGRPLSAMADRAGCSPRIIHEIVREVIYVAEPPGGLERWLELGLVTVPAVAYRRPQASRTQDRDRLLAAPYLPVFCLVCHRRVGLQDPTVKTCDGRLLNAEELKWNILDGGGRSSDLYEVGCDVQGHLIGHFKLGHDPIKLPDSHLLDSFRAVLGTPKIAAAATRRLESRDRIGRRVGWRGQVHPEAVRRIRMARLLPVRNGEVMTQAGAESHWKGLLADG